MWVDIRGSLYNLDQYYKIIKTIDECESYKHFCIMMFFKNGKKETDFTIISFEDELRRNDVYEKLWDSIVQGIDKKERIQEELQEKLDEAEELVIIVTRENEELLGQLEELQNGIQTMKEENKELRKRLDSAKEAIVVA
jgi:chromosome segregation ATPase